MEYQPAVCNIGQAEIMRRKRFEWVGAGATVVLWLFLVLYHAPAVWRLMLFFTAAIGAMGFLQAYMHFCAAFGFLGVFNFGPRAGRTEKVKEEFRQGDRKRALQIVVYSILVAALVAIITFLLPF